MTALTAQLSKDGAILESYLDFVREFWAIRPTMPLGHAYSFMLVALKEGCSVQEYARLANVSQNVMTRVLLDLGERNRYKEPGYGLVMRRINPIDMRQHQTFLTPDGHALVQRLEMAMRFKMGNSASTIVADSATRRWNDKSP
jgi:DNA-binding MarR family transcriptional regulator